MVHTLRNKKVCETSPESYYSLNGTTFNFAYPDRLRNHVLQASSPLHSSTPLRNSVLQSTAIEPLVPFRNSMLQSTRITRYVVHSGLTNQPTQDLHRNEEIRAANNTAYPISCIEQSKLPRDLPSVDGNNNTINAASNSEITKASNVSRFQHNLWSCIDQVICKRTFKKIGGVSLYAIKKSLNEEFGYDTFHFRKSICDYVRGALVCGNLQQVSGKGAAGSVRLNPNIHRSVARKLRKGNGVTKAKNRRTFSSNTSRAAHMMLHACSINRLRSH